MSELIRLTFRKYDGTLHWHSVLRRLGEDEHGLWLGWSRGQQVARGSQPPITLETPYVRLVRREDWWCGTFNDAPVLTEIYCDVTTVARWTAPDELTLVDLDLDVLRLRDGTAPFIDDEDEFLEHQARYRYPADVIAKARETADALLESVKADEEPFATAYHRWLALVADVNGDPGAA